MAVTFQLEILTPTLQRVHVVTEVVQLALIRRVNAIGQGTLTVPRAALNERWLNRDYVLVVWQSIDGATPRLLDQTAWFLTAYEEDVDQALLTLELEDSISLLRRRIIAYAAASGEAEKNGAADDLMKAVVRENMGALVTDAARQFDSARFGVATNLAAGPAVTLSASREIVLAALQDVAQRAWQEGTYVAFDVVYTPGAGFEFRTYLNQRGSDRRSGVGKVLIGPQYGNLTGGIVRRDWSREVNAAYAGGQGEESERLVGTAVDAARATQTPWARQEGWSNAYQAKTQAAVDSQAKRMLREGLPRRSLRGTFVDTPGLRLGRHVQFGDRVVVDVRGQLFDTRLEAVSYTRDTDGVYAAACALESEQMYG